MSIEYKLTLVNQIKNKVKIVTDSASDLPLDEAERLGIEIVPLSIRFDNETFLDGKEITTPEFYAKLATAKTFPQTAAPSPGAFAEAFEKQAAAGAEEILCIALSSKLSATMQSAELAATTLKDTHKIHIFDSRTATAGELLYVLEAHKLAEAGKSATEICAELKLFQKAGRMQCYGILNTVENLKMSGRIGSARALLAGALNIKPILSLGNGEIEPETRVRTRKKAFEWICNKVASLKDYRSLAIGHGNADDFDVLLKMLKDVVGVDIEADNVMTGQIGPVVGAHAGSGTIGLAYFLN